ncbi:hypothetical protein QBC32DRAFT_364712 [Pseudoneurospora amorphoporcata]|uniref:G-protein coupled receptors family 2 profile 2 domain-containing protein n=1 Tax=Pseudoneurospora amorphoporcata TaxID=241081 RepID=A0AAN6SC59_9PEZI|nr:hypothetical protein QBC32DRAFT_364712 [Pseudoneurospora amorphoporcata]
MAEFTGTTTQVQAQVEQPQPEVVLVEYSQGYMNLTQTQRDTIEHVERIGASLSLLGVFLIFIAYGLFKRVRTVPNTFILFASIANVGASTACFIGYAGIIAGEDSALCHTQAFLLEMFMQSDPWWSLAMAVNVFLVFFFALNPNAFRDYLWLYCLVCYGLPSIPAIVLLAHSPSNDHYYGNATLWCWIADTWNPLRIYTYYLPIWTCIFLSGLVYLAVGYQVFHQRNQLRNLTFSNQGKNCSGSDHREHIELGEKHSYGISAGRNSPCPPVIPMDLSSHPGCYGTVTTQVEVNISDNTDIQPMTPRGTSPTPSITEVPLAAHPAGHQNNNSIHPWASNCSSSSSSNSEDHIVPPTAVYAGSGGGSGGSPPPFRMTTHHVHIHHATDMTASGGQPKSSLKKTTYSSHHVGYGHTYSSYNCTSNTTTTSSSCSNNPNHQNQSSRFTPQTRLSNLLSTIRRPFRKFWAKLHRLDPIKLAYLRTSFVFAISILVTWTPSSINRVHSLLYPKDTSYPLNLASAVVLPLQGVWNAVIFMATTWAVLREEVEGLWDRSWAGRWWMQRRQSLGPSGTGTGTGTGYGYGYGGHGGLHQKNGVMHMGGQHKRGVRLGSDGLPPPPSTCTAIGGGSTSVRMAVGHGGGRKGGGYGAKGHKAWRNGNGAYGYGVPPPPPVIKDDFMFETRSCGSAGDGGGRKKKAKKGPMDPNRLGTVRVIRGGSL